MILPAFVGLIIDKLGNRRSLIIMCIVWILSQGILFVAALVNSYAWIFLGSVLCGITNGSMSVNFCKYYIIKFFYMCYSY